MFEIQQARQDFGNLTQWFNYFLQLTKNWNYDYVAQNLEKILKDFTLRKIIVGYWAQYFPDEFVKNENGILVPSKDLIRKKGIKIHVSLPYIQNAAINISYLVPSLLTISWYLNWLRVPFKVAGYLSKIFNLDNSLQRGKHITIYTLNIPQAVRIAHAIYYFKDWLRKRGIYSVNILREPEFVPTPGSPLLGIGIRPSDGYGKEDETLREERFFQELLLDIWNFPFITWKYYDKIQRLKSFLERAKREYNVKINSNLLDPSHNEFYSIIINQWENNKGNFVRIEDSSVVFVRNEMKMVIRELLSPLRGEFYLLLNNGYLKYNNGEINKRNVRTNLGDRTILVIPLREEGKIYLLKLFGDPFVCYNEFGDLI